MKWMKERDLLIAQTMAFVQSVAGKKPDAGQPAAAPADSELAGSELNVRAPGIEAAATDAIERALAIAASPKAELPKAEALKSVEIARINSAGDYRSEIQSRVANFRAHQQRISQEREAYCSATLARIHAAIGNDGAPLRK
jgi:hypothetical protein